MPQYRAHPLVPDIESYEVLDVTYTLSAQEPLQALVEMTIHRPGIKRILVFKDVQDFSLRQSVPGQISGLTILDIGDWQLEQLGVKVESSACKLYARAVVERLPEGGPEVTGMDGPPLDPQERFYLRRPRFAPERLGEWCALNEAQRWEWLVNARDRVFSRHAAVRHHGPRTSVVLEGSLIHDLSSFFCAIGEAVNGPGGYFGLSLSALNDCLHGGFGLEKPCEIVWKDSAAAAKALDSSVLWSWCREQLDRLDQEEDLSLFREGYVGLLRTLAEATDGKKSMFDEVVASIRHHSYPGGIALKLD